MNGKLSKAITTISELVFQEPNRHRETRILKRMLKRRVKKLSDSEKYKFRTTGILKKEIPNIKAAVIHMTRRLTELRLLRIRKSQS